MNMALQTRLRLIDFLLDNYGQVHRQVVMDYFGISMPQASSDFAEYQKLFPENMTYCKTQRRYLKSPSFVRRLP